MTEKPNLVLAAGLLCDAEVWQPVADRLADVAEVTIVAFAGCGSLGALEASGRKLSDFSPHDASPLLLARSQAAEAQEGPAGGCLRGESNPPC